MNFSWILYISDSSKEETFVEEKLVVRNSRPYMSKTFLILASYWMISPILWPPDETRWLIGKDPNAGKDWGQEEKRVAEYEMAGWHHWLNGHQFEQTSGDNEGRGGLACCSPWASKRWTWVSHWTTITLVAETHVSGRKRARKQPCCWEMRGSMYKLWDWAPESSSFTEWRTQLGLLSPLDSFFWMCWVFIAVCGHLLLWSTDSRAPGLSSCGAQA